MAWSFLMAAAIGLHGAGDARLVNPVWPHNFPDPHVVQDGDWFYAVATQKDDRGFQILRSKDLARWEELPPIGLVDWAAGNYWAPELYKRNGRWYLLFTALDRADNKRDVAVSVADRPEGPYRFVAKLARGRTVNDNPGDPNGVIDGTLYDEGGRTYLLSIRETPPRSIEIVEVSTDLTRPLGRPKPILFADRPIERGILDAPTLVRHQGRYWLFYSGGWFQSWKRDACYHVGVAVADSLMGPYRKLDKPILETLPGKVYSPGHQCLLRLPSGEWWIGYHAWDAEGEPMYGHNPRGRSFRLDRLQWTPGGPRVLGPSVDPIPAPKLR
ncbi:MAG: glycoside hydrolase family 43 protein [Armatimonadetes bacterium]|jgi:arabinan endo-1,5-alpha-L-arabinosidase|nr:glycoside hydrolase family 43 protein [Armatimonadota bacterium]MCA1996354.1 glycoside hydrolase family 43 protein [Armatimonadota bacterium]